MEALLPLVPVSVYVILPLACLTPSPRAWSWLRTSALLLASGSSVLVALMPGGGGAVTFVLSPPPDAARAMSAIARERTAIARKNANARAIDLEKRRDMGSSSVPSKCGLTRGDYFACVLLSSVAGARQQLGIGYTQLLAHDSADVMLNLG